MVTKQDTLLCQDCTLLLTIKIHDCKFCWKTNKQTPKYPKVFDRKTYFVFCLYFHLVSLMQRHLNRSLSEVSLRHITRDLLWWRGRQAMTPMKENVATRTAAQHRMKKMWAPSAIEAGGVGGGWHVYHISHASSKSDEKSLKSST